MESLNEQYKRLETIKQKLEFGEPKDKILAELVVAQRALVNLAHHLNK